MGPSGAGKTTLISTLTLDAHFGKASGSVTLNQIPLTGPIFKKHCFGTSFIWMKIGFNHCDLFADCLICVVSCSFIPFYAVVKQKDKHWPYLTLRETLAYAAGLYDVSDSRENTAIVVDEIIEKMGLIVCADTRCSRLSGGQQRRLSIAVALLKQPTVIFLDEPTSGLDAAAASNIMQEITRVAKDEQLIIVCTIHQPSTKVYNGFDQVMVLSRGREAFMGDVGDAAPYFESIGHPMPENTNPAEHFLDLVNSDFSGEEDVTKILDQWTGTQGANQSTHGADPSTHDSNKNGSDDDNVGADRVDELQNSSGLKEVSIMFRRHLTLISRDPILYVGRCLMFLISCCVFAFVYWNARKFELDQIFNKMWVQVWFVAVPTNSKLSILCIRAFCGLFVLTNSFNFIPLVGVVAVYALNDEFKSIQRESQNGMISAGSYVFAKSLLTLPILFIFAAFALLIPNYVIQDVPWSAFGLTICLYAAMLFVYESVAEALSVLFENPIVSSSPKKKNSEFFHCKSVDLMLMLLRYRFVNRSILAAWHATIYEFLVRHLFVRRLSHWGRRFVLAIQALFLHHAFWSLSPKYNVCYHLRERLVRSESQY
jgi:ABC-type multidrug transport system ATPase subunit